MGDRGIPASWRHMNLYSGHTFIWVNAAGEKVWVRYHFITDQGIENLTGRGRRAGGGGYRLSHA